MKNCLKAIVLAVVLIPQMGFSSNDIAFKNVVDDYVFSMEVEWDQIDKKFATLKEQELKDNIYSLIQNGLTDIDVITAFPDYRSDILLNEIKKINISNDRELIEFITKNKEQLYKQGASWNALNENLGFKIGVAIGLGFILILNQRIKTNCADKQMNVIECSDLI